MAQNVPNTRTFKDVTGLTGGVNSFLDPQFIEDTQVRWAENAVNKGGIWQTRPGYDTVLDLNLSNQNSALYLWLSNYGESSDTITSTVGLKSLYINSPRSFSNNENVTITNLSNPAISMQGQVVNQNGQFINAGNFVVGDQYIIRSVGTTDFTLIGAGDNNIGTIFIATGAGSGTGIAQEQYPDNYVVVNVTSSTGYITGSGWTIELSANNLLPLVPQFFTVFQPTNGGPQFVYGISGGIFISNINADGTYDEPRQLQQLVFDTNVDQMCVCNTVRSATIQDGTVFITQPVNTLMIQDGVSRAGYWDGTSGNHLNPTKQWTLDSKGNIIYTDGYNQTRIGKYMAWSGNRLWVSNGTQLFASDPSDPLHFTEETVLTNIPVFTFPKNITGLIDRGTSGNLENLMYIGTEDSIYVIHTGVQQRSSWVSITDFVRKIFAGVGSVSHKAMICHKGLLY